MLPSTVDRVPQNTAHEFNVRIQREIGQRVAAYANADIVTIDRRMEELDHEWDIERTLEANAATVSLVGLGLGAFVDRRFYIVPALVSGFLLQHALQGWCPPLRLFRRLGVRTASEIESERSALRAIRRGMEDQDSATGLQPSEISSDADGRK